MKQGGDRERRERERVEPGGERERVEPGGERERETWR